MNRVIHAITPGDHFSPRTGSAIPTVVHGLAGAAGRDAARPRYPQLVALGADTLRPRYPSAEAIEFVDVPAPTRNERVLDVALGRLGLPRRAAARYFRPLAAALTGEEPSIVLAHNAPILPWLLRKSPHRVILYAHNDILRTLTKGEAARMLGSVAAIVCVSESLAAQTRSHLPDSLLDRVHVVVNGVDCQQFSPGQSTPSERVRVLFVGRMIEDKGADLLLRAAAELDRDDIEIEVVGSSGFDRDARLSSYEETLRELAGRSRVPVTFRPFVARTELPDLLRSADIMVVPSRWPDPCPLTVGEALATGLPLIANRVGGIPEIVGSSAILIDNESPTELATTIAKLADRGDLRASLGAAARSQAESHDWAWAWSNLKTVLDRVGA